MKAVRLSTDRLHQVVEAPPPEPTDDEVLVRPAYCGICGSDLHAADIALFRPGVIVGHEFTGEIVHAGRNVRDWQAGQRVVINPNGNVCHRCRACREGRYNQCRVATQDNPLGVVRDGGMAELVAVDPSYLNALPDGLDTRRGAWVEPLAVAVRSVRTSRVRLGDSVTVLGGGPIGQLVVQLLRRAGASPIVLVETSPFRAQLGLRSGADEVLSPDDALTRMTAGTMMAAEHVFECSGSPLAPQVAVEIVAAGGTVRLVGMPPRPVTLDTAAAIVKEVSISTGFVYLPDEFALAIRLLADGVVEVDPLTTDVLPLEAFNDALAALRQPHATMKVLVRIGLD